MPGRYSGYRRRYARTPSKRERQSRLKRLISMKVNADKELKTQCAVNSATLANGTWDVNAINLIPQGDSADDRDGLEIMEQGYHIRGALYSPTDRPAMVRVMVVRAKEVTLTTADLPTSVYACVDNDMRHQFSVHYDKLFSLNPSSNATNAASATTLRIDHNGLAKVRYNSATDSDFAAGSGLYVCLLYSNVVSPGTDTPDIAWQSEYLYKEY